jgi:Holliday junction resolvase RusA-like endonuclease
MTITFHVDGDPQPKGSTRAFVVQKAGGKPRAVVTADNKAPARNWAALVRDAATQEAGPSILFPRGVPVRLTVLFTLPRPVSLPQRVVAPTKKPDLDKLLRNVKDALTGVVWQDDSQVIEISSRKRYACGTERPGIVVEVRSIVAIETTAHGLFDQEARPA